jgi:hypothetical protein
MAKTAAAVAVKAYEEGGGKQDINKSDKQPVCTMLFFIHVLHSVAVYSVLCYTALQATQLCITNIMTMLRVECTT